MIDAAELSKACAAIVEAYKADSYFRDAFVSSVASAYMDSMRTMHESSTVRDLAEKMAGRLLDVERKF